MLNLLAQTHRAPGECIITVDDAEISDLYPFLIGVSVDTSREAAAEATLRFEVRRDIDGRWLVQDDARIRPWRRLRIDAAFGEHTEEVMRGYVREVRVDYPTDPGGAELTLIAQDESLLLDREHKRRNWGGDAPTSDAAVVAQIISDHNLAPEEPPAAGQANLVLNQDGTDIVLLQRRAAANGYELIFRAGRVYFGPIRLTGSPQATIMVYAGPATNCIEFTVRHDGHRPDRVSFELAAERGAATRSETVEPDLPLLGTEPASSDAVLDGRFDWRINRQGYSDEDHMRAVARQRANRESLKIQASGALDGTLYGHVLQVGALVGVDGAGAKHSGVYYVDRVSHRFDADGYRQDFELLRNAFGDNLPSGGLGVAGLI